MEKIIVYSTDWCAYCKMTMEYLNRKHMPVIEKNIEEDEAAKEELLKKMNGNFSGVPVIDICGDMILGFDRLKIDVSIKKHAKQLGVDVE